MSRAATSRLAASIDCWMENHHSNTVSNFPLGLWMASRAPELPELLPVIFEPSHLINKEWETARLKSSQKKWRTSEMRKCIARMTSFRTGNYKTETLDMFKSCTLLSVFICSRIPRWILFSVGKFQQNLFGLGNVDANQGTKRSPTPRPLQRVHKLPPMKNHRQMPTSRSSKQPVLMFRIWSSHPS